MTGFIRRFDSVRAFSQIASISPSATTYSVYNLIAGTDYYFRVQAHNGAASGYSNAASVTTFPVPLAPTNVSATVVSSSQINLTWTNADTSGTVMVIAVEESINGGAYNQIASVSPSATSYGVYGLSTGTTVYGFRLLTANGAVSPLSNVASNVPLALANVSSQSANAGSALSISTTVTPPADESSPSFTGTVAWGDGQTSAATFTLASGTWTVTASHIYVNTGPDTATLSVADSASADSTSNTFSVTVAPVSSAALFNPVASYNFAESSGNTALDGTGNGNTGTLSSTGVTRTTDSLFGNALSFDGAGSVDLGNPTDLNFGGQIAISAWIKPTAMTGTENIVAHGYYLNSGSRAEVALRIEIETDGSFKYEIGSDNGSFSGTSAPMSTSDFGQWVNLIGLYNGTSWQLYRNGVLINSTVAAVGSETVSADWAIGAGTAPGDTRNFTGEIANVQIYNQALTQQQVTALANPGAGAQAVSLTVTGDSFSAAPGQLFDGDVADFSSSDPSATTSTYSATIHWGDGNTSTGTVESDGNGGFFVEGSNTYASEGIYAATVTITGSATATGDAASATTTLSADVTTLTATGETIAGVQGQGFSGIVAAFTDTDTGTTTGSYTASIDWGDGTTTAGAIGSLGNGTFTVSGSDPLATAGMLEPVITITQASGATATAFSTANISGLTATTEPISATQDQSFTGELADFTDTAPDASSQTYTASINWGDGNTSTGTIAADGNGGFTVTGTDTYLAPGLYNATVTLLSTDGRTVVSDVAANVSSLTGTGNTLTLTQGQDFTGTVATFTDANSGTTTGSYTASIDWGDANDTTTTGTIVALGGDTFTVTGSDTYTDAGTFNPAITITDPSGATITINGEADVSGLSGTASTLTLTQGQSYTGQVADFTDTASDASTQTYTASIVWGDGNTSTGTIASDGTGGFTVSGTDTYTLAGTLTPTITIQSTDGRTASIQGEADVAGLTLASGEPASLSATQGQSFTGIVADFTDSAADASTQTYTASIQWGDGHTSTGTISSDGNGGFNVTGSDTYAAEGSYNATVTILSSDSRTLASTVSVGVTGVTAVGQTITGVQGQNFTGIVATFTDANSATSASSYAASIYWGDGNASDGTIASSGSGTFTVSGSNIFAAAGTLDPVITITDPSGNVATATDTATVEGIIPVAQTLSVTNGQAVTGTLATFTDTAPSNSFDSYTAFVDWNDDGNPVAATITAAGGGEYIITGSYVFTSAGTFNPDITIQDSDGRDGSASDEVDVASIISPIANQTVAEGQTLSVSTTVTPVPGITPDFTGTIDWGDGSTPTVATFTETSGTWTVSGSYTYTTAGDYTPTVTVNDGTISDEASFNVTQQGPTVAPIADQTVSEGENTVSVSTIVTPLAGNASALTGTIDWGDGSTPTTATLTENSDGTWTASGSYTYATPGTYAATLNVTDGTGTSATTFTNTLQQSGFTYAWHYGDGNPLPTLVTTPGSDSASLIIPESAGTFYGPAVVTVSYDVTYWGSAGYTGSPPVVDSTDPPPVIETRSETYTGYLDADGQISVSVSQGLDAGFAASSPTHVLLNDGTFHFTTDTIDNVSVTIGPEDVVGVQVTKWAAERGTGQTDEFTFTRTGDLSQSLDVYYTMTGTAVEGVDYTALPTDPVSGLHDITFAAGEATATVEVDPTGPVGPPGYQTVGITIADPPVAANPYLVIGEEPGSTQPTSQPAAGDQTSINNVDQFKLSQDFLKQWVPKLQTGNKDEELQAYDAILKACAPHSTSPELIKQIDDFSENQNQPAQSQLDWMGILNILQEGKDKVLIVLEGNHRRIDNPFADVINLRGGGKYMIRISSDDNSVIKTREYPPSASVDNGMQANTTLPLIGQNKGTVVVTLELVDLTTPGLDVIGTITRVIEVK